jgi:hypothetical protein
MSQEETLTDKYPNRFKPKDFTFRGMPPWVREMYRISERNAKRRNIPFNLTRQEFREMVERSEGRCMMTGIEFEFDRFEGSCRRPFAPSLDRIRSTEGYTADNCRLICVLVNLALNQWGAEPLLRVARNLVQRENEIKAREDANAIYGPAEFLSVSEYAATQNLSLSNRQSTLAGSAAGRLCRKLGVDPAFIHHKKKDGSAGFIARNAYPVAVLHQVFSEVRL